MDSNIIRHTTPEQKEVVDGINIMPFVNQPSEYEDFDEDAEMVSAVLNNTPGNLTIEEMKHLNELEEMCQNYSESEWKRVLYHVPSDLALAELGRRLTGYEEENDTLVGVFDVVEKLKLIRRR